MDKKLDITLTPLDGLFVIEPNRFIDERGSFSRVYCEEELKEITNIDIKQINQSHTKEKGTLRGMHFQYEPNTEVKILKCIRGKVFDVVVDIRRGSSTFLKSYSIELSAENQKMLYIPKGFAHGFQTLEDDTELLYLHSSIYTPSNEGALNAIDPLLDIKWPLKIINLSNRDSEHKFLDNNFQGIEINEL